MECQFLIPVISWNVYSIYGDIGQRYCRKKGWPTGRMFITIENGTITQFRLYLFTRYLVLVYDVFSMWYYRGNTIKIVVVLYTSTSTRYGIFIYIVECVDPCTCKYIRTRSTYSYFPKILAFARRVIIYTSILVQVLYLVDDWWVIYSWRTSTAITCTSTSVCLLSCTVLHLRNVAWTNQSKKGNRSFFALYEYQVPGTPLQLLRTYCSMLMTVVQAATVTFCLLILVPGTVIFLFYQAEVLVHV